MDPEPALSTMFPTLAAARHPGYDEMLTALEREFRAVDGARLADVLDDAARPILGAASLPPRRRALALAEAAWSALPVTAAEPPAWMVSEALRTGAAAPPLRAAVAVELGRRAGVAARPVRLRGRWLVAVHEPGLSPVGADAGADDDLAPEGIDGCLCPHELAFVILGRLAECVVRTPARRRARTAPPACASCSRSAPGCRPRPART